MLKTNNEDAGFYGEAKGVNGEDFAKQAWEVAFQHITGMMGWEEELTRDFLDSTYGRHWAARLYGREDWKRLLLRDSNLEQNCRDFWEASNKPGYRNWCKINGKTPTHRVFNTHNFCRHDLQTALQNLLGLDYSLAAVTEMIQKAGPLAAGFVLLLNELPETARNEYLKN